MMEPKREESPTVMISDEDDMGVGIYNSPSQGPPSQPPSTFEDEQQSSNNQKSGQQQKRVYRKKFTHEWSHDDTTHLIGLWRSEESTYNKRYHGYRLKAERTSAYERIRLGMGDYGVVVSAEEIYCKMHSLRVYYSATNNKAEAAKRKYGSEDEAFITWPYYEKLSFLKQNMNPRTQQQQEARTRTRRNNRIRDNNIMSGTPSMVVAYSNQNNSVATSSASAPAAEDDVDTSMMQQQNESSGSSPSSSLNFESNLPSLMVTKRARTSQLTTPDTTIYSPVQPTQQQQDDDSSEELTADDLFCKMLAIQLKELPKQTREFAKHEISGVMLRMRFPEHRT